MKNKIILHSNVVPISLSPQALHESSGQKEGRMIFPTILQRINAKNENGRIYPENTMRREIGNYIEGPIAEKRAYGELDHCFCDDDFDVLTENGWKSFNNVVVGENVLSFNVHTKTYEYKKVLNKISNDYAGESFFVSGRNINTHVSPNHKFVIEDRNGNITLTTIKEIFENRSKFNKHKILKTGFWKTDNDKIILKGCKYSKGKFPYEDDLEIDAKIFCGILGIWLAEGHLSRRNADNGQIIISQNSGNKFDEIISLLNKSGLDYIIRKNSSKQEYNQISIKDHRLFSFMKNLGNKYNKYIPESIKQLSSECLKELLYYYNLGDGRKHDSYGRERKNIFTVSDRLIDDLQECLIKTGSSGNITKIRQKASILSDGREIIPTKDLDLKQLEFSSTTGIYLDERFLEIKRDYYEGNIYCLEIEDNHTFYVRHNGKCFITGNSDRQVVEFKNACLHINDIWWKGDEVWGSIEVLDTPSGKIIQEILKKGFSVGISSRGLGSVTDIDENTVEVDDDYVLICWDAVTNPSTHGAFLQTGASDGLLKENKSQEVETDKIDEVIADILCQNLGFCECKLKV